MHGGSDLGWSVILPRGPVPDIEPLTDEEEKELINGTGRKLNGLSIKDMPRGMVASENPFSAYGDKSGMGAIFGADIDSPTPDGDESTTATTTAAPTSVGSPRSAQDEEDENDNGVDENGEFHPRRMIKRRTTYSDENAKWYKAAKKAEEEVRAKSREVEAQREAEEALRMQAVARSSA